MRFELMPSTCYWVVGYLAFFASLCLPASEPSMLVNGYGYQYFAMSYWGTCWLLLDTPFWEGFGWDGTVMMLASWANTWLVLGGIVHFARFRRLCLFGACWGYTAMALALLLGLPGGFEGLYAGYWLWCAALALTATAAAFDARRIIGRDDWPSRQSRGAALRNQARTSGRTPFDSLPPPGQI